MHTIGAILERLEREPRGQTVLANLLHSIDARLISAGRVHAALENFLRDLGSGSDPLPTCQVLAERLGGHFVKQGIHLNSKKPRLHRHRAGGRQVLSRIVSYENLHGMLTRAGLPNRCLPPPRLPTAAGGGEIARGKVSALRDYMQRRQWERDVLMRHFGMSKEVTWLTASAALPPIAAGAEDLADRYRDQLGLCHLNTGRHLFRIDIDLSKDPFPDEWHCRRPHGAGNGGARFRVAYDKPDKRCNWGRTVDLKLLRQQATLQQQACPIDGVPELLIDQCKPRIDAVDIHYVGRVTCDAEREDEYFARRLGAAGAAVLQQRLCAGRKS